MIEPTNIKIIVQKRTINQIKAVNNGNQTILYKNKTADNSNKATFYFIERADCSNKTALYFIRTKISNHNGTD